MKQFFNARKIAIIGASRHEKKVGHSVLKNLLKNSKLTVYPINPKAKEILGKQSYPSVLDVPDYIDLAVIVVKAELVPGIMKELAKKRVKSAIIISAGFSETGNKRLENKVKEIAEENNIKILGPNVLGLIYPKRSLNISFFDKIPLSGEIAFISQSGALGTAFLDRAIKENLGLSGFLSLGNQIDIDFNQALDYFSRDKETKVIALYMESLKEEKGREFIELCRKSRKKIIVLKAGETKEGKRAAQSHTSALATDTRVYSGAFKQAGIIQAESLDELFLLSKLFTKIKSLGNRSIIITNAGGLGILATDAFIRNKINVINIPGKIAKKLDKILPKTWSRNDPMDITGDALAERYAGVLHLLDRESFFDFFAILLTPQQMTQPLGTAIILPSLRKPVFACFIGGKHVEQANEFLKHHKIPVFDDVYDMAKVLGKVIS